MGVGNSTFPNDPNTPLNLPVIASSGTGLATIPSSGTGLATIPSSGTGLATIPTVNSSIATLPTKPPAPTVNSSSIAFLETYLDPMKTAIAQEEQNFLTFWPECFATDTTVNLASVKHTAAETVVFLWDMDNVTQSQFLYRRLYLTTYLMDYCQLNGLTDGYNKMATIVGLQALSKYLLTPATAPTLWDAEAVNACIDVFMFTYLNMLQGKPAPPAGMLRRGPDLQKLPLYQVLKNMEGVSWPTQRNAESLSTQHNAESLSTQHDVKTLSAKMSSLFSCP